MYDTRESRTTFYKLILQRTRKHISIILIVGILLSLTGCSFFGKNQNDPQGFSPIRLEKLEDTVDTVVKGYFYDKYGVEADVTYKSIAGGVFLGPDPSSVQYYLVTVNITEEGVENEYYVEVHGREVNGQDELYVKKEAYYGKVIKERMEEWLDSYMCNTDIHEYYVLYNSTISNQFPSEFAINATAEEILDEVEISKSIKEKVSFSDNIMAFMDLETSGIDAVFVDEVLANYYIASNNKDYRVLEEVLEEEEYVIGFRKQDTELTEKVNEILSEMKKDGSLGKISKQWFGKDVTITK